MGSRPKAKSKAAPKSSSRGFFQQSWVAPAALVILMALVYARSLGVPIHDWDDHVYFFRDVRVDQLSGENLMRILTQGFFSNFHPVTTLTIAFDRAVWKTWVPGFHITQLLFYAGGVVALYFLFARILGRRAEAFVAAAIYATHAIHVESVAWLASRKDVVCLFFYAMALLAYAIYAGSTKGRWRPYALSVILTCAAMLSKGYAVILPAVFFAYDLCFSGRLTRRRVVDKIPYVLLAAATTLLTIRAQDQEGALIQIALTGGERAFRLFEVLGWYAIRTVLPVHLSAIYSTGTEPVVGAVALLGVVFALVLAAGFVWLRRGLPAAAFGIALYVLPLATVMNLYYTLRIWMTDRYLLLPTIGSSLAIVAIAASLYRKRGTSTSAPRVRGLRRGLAVAAGLVIALYSALTVARIGVWTSGVSLWSDVVRHQLHLGGAGPVTARELDRVDLRHLVDPGPLVSLRRAYEARGRNVEAGEIENALARVEQRSDEHSGMKRAREAMAAGRYEEALRLLQPVAAGKSWFAPLAMFRIAVAQERMGQAEASRESMRRALLMYHEHSQPPTDAYFEVGTMEYLNRNFAKAVEWYRLALRESPHEADTALHLGLALEETGNVPEAMGLYERIVTRDLIIKPHSRITIPDVYLQMGVAAQKLGQPEKALGYLDEALRLSPNHPKRAAVLAEIAKLRAGGGPAK